MGSTTQPSKMRTSLAPASMVGGGPGRWYASVSAPRKKVAKIRQVFLNEPGRKERRRRTGRGQASRMVKFRRCAVRMPAPIARAGGIRGFLK